MNQQISLETLLPMNRADRRRKRKAPKPGKREVYTQAERAAHQQIVLRANSNEPLTDMAAYRVLTPTGCRLNELRAGKLDHEGMIDLHYGMLLGVYMIMFIEMLPGGHDVKEVSALLPEMKDACDALSSIAERGPQVQKFIGTGDEYKRLDRGYQILALVLDVALTKHLERAHQSAARDVKATIDDFNRQPGDAYLSVPNFVEHNPAKYQCGLMAHKMQTT